MRQIVVTGANKGIGLAIAKGILEQHDDTFVWLGSRDPGRGQDARSTLVAGNPLRAERIEVLPLDVTNADSIAAAARRIATASAQTATPLYGLVNNAGVAGADLPTTIAINTVGLQHVTEALRPLLMPNGRIVNVTSAAGPNFVAASRESERASFVDASLTQEAYEALVAKVIGAQTPAGLQALGLGQDAYGASKALANAYTMLLARLHPTLVVNAVTPGFIETDLTRPFAENAGRTPAEMGMKTPDEGAVAPLHLLFGSLEGNGRYYGSDAQRSPLDRYRSPGDPPYTGP